MESKVISKNNQKEISSPNSIPFATESVNSSQPVEHVHLNITDVKFNKENQKTQSRFAGEGLCRRESLHSPTVKSENKSSDIWSRRGKSRGVLQIQTDNSRAKIKKANVDAEDEVQNEDTENRSITKALFSSLDGDEEVFTPDKKNLTPNTLLLKSLKKKGMLEEIKYLNSNKSCFSKVACISNGNPEEDVLTASDKENQTPKILQEKKPAKATSLNQTRFEKEIMVTKKNAERVPFQSIHVNSASKSKSQASLRNSPLRKSNTVTSTLAMEKNANTSSNNTFGNGKKIWNMVVDTTTLLNKESMKSLKLLQGLKGTHLVIPATVLWELDCLKRRGYLFRSNAEVASALEWIEECLSETKWWDSCSEFTRGWKTDCKNSSCVSSREPIFEAQFWLWTQVISSPVRRFKIHNLETVCMY